jgi:hypothetical protein
MYPSFFLKNSSSRRLVFKLVWNKSDTIFDGPINAGQYWHACRPRKVNRQCRGPSLKEGLSIPSSSAPISLTSEPKRLKPTCHSQKRPQRPPIRSGSPCSSSSPLARPLRFSWTLAVAPPALPAPDDACSSFPSSSSPSGQYSPSCKVAFLLPMMKLSVFFPLSSCLPC